MTFSTKPLLHSIAILALTFMASSSLYAQKIIIGFYNCENFYDTIDQVNVIDEDFLPKSEKKYTSKVFEIKARHLVNTFYQMGFLENENNEPHNLINNLAFIGLAEIENKMVLSSLINHPMLKKYHYQFIHFDSKDPRGVDVALIYNPALFKPYQYKPFSLTDASHFTKYATRDILFVKGLLMNQWVYILVNHWPSRRGGEWLSAGKRKWASQICTRIMDSVYLENPKAQFIVMGDFNDNPNNQSIKMLKMINPFGLLYAKGMGSIAYNDSWNLFDQILLSPNWGSTVMSDSLRTNLNSYKSIIYKNSYMIENSGKYRGYPKRTYNGNEFGAGFSDHFPVGLIFTLKSAGNP